MKLQFIEAGEIVTTHGIRGEVKVLPWLDSPEDLCDFERCRISGVEYTIENCRIQKSCNLVKLEGIDTMEDAQKMRGKVIELYREDIDDEVILCVNDPNDLIPVRRCSQILLKFFTIKIPSRVPLKSTTTTFMRSTFSWVDRWITGWKAAFCV